MIGPKLYWDFAKEFLGINNVLNGVTKKDITQIISKYHDYIKTRYAEVPAVDKTVSPLGIEIMWGLNEIYGKTDSGKTSIACNMANWFAHRGISTVFVDADNKLTPGQLIDSPNIIYISGRKETHDILRKFITSRTVGAIVIDTIYSMSYYEKFLRSAVKTLRSSEIYCVMINQSRQWRYGDHSAGSDTIDNLSRIVYRIVKCSKIGNKYVIFTKNGNRLVFDIPTDDETGTKLLSFNAAETGIATARKTGDLQKIGRNYSLNYKSMTRKETIELYENKLIELDWHPDKVQNYENTTK